MRKKTVKVAPVMALLLVCVLVFGTGPAANATTAAAVELVMNAHLPEFPCPNGCQVSSLSGKVNGALVGTASHGATICANNCQLTLGPAGLTYEEPPCFVGRLPATAGAHGDVQIIGGSNLRAAETPVVLHISYFREGVVAVITFTSGQLGVTVGLFRTTSPTIPPCDGSAQDVQIIGAGMVVT